MRAMLRSRSAREKVSPADRSCRTRSPSSSDTVRSPRSVSASASPRAMVDLPEPDRPVKKMTRPRSARASGPAAAPGPRSPGRTRADLGPGIQQRAQLGVGQLALLGAGLISASGPDLRARVVGPLAAPMTGIRTPGRATGRSWYRRGAGRLRDFGGVGQQVGGAVGGGHDGLGAQVRAGPAGPPGQRHRYDQRARREVLPGREHGPDQGLRPRDDVGAPGDQRQHQQPGVQLAGVMAQLADVALVQRPPGGVGEHGPVGELTADRLRTPPQLAERPCPARAAP